MIYYLITNSVTDEVNRKLALKPKLFTLLVEGKPIQSGVLLLKVLIDTYYSSTKTTTMEIRSKLSRLPSYMENVALGDVKKLCDYTRSQMTELEAAGETSSDLISNLFNALERSPNGKFTRWLEHLKGKYTLKKIDFNEDGSDLMDLAEQFYMSLQADTTYKYKKPSMYALQAATDTNTETQWTNLSNQMLALAAQVQHKDTDSNTEDKSQLTQLSNQLLAFAAQIKNKEDTNKKWKWKTLPPKQGESTTKLRMVDGVERKYHWCHNHKKWTLHSPQECKGTGYYGNIRGRKDKRETIKTNLQNMQIAFQALSASMAEDSDDDSNCTITSSNSNTTKISIEKTEENEQPSAYASSDDSDLS